MVRKPLVFMAGIISGIVLMTTSVQATASQLGDLQPFLWENRLILIHAAAEQVEALETELRDANFEIEDRHIVWFIFSGNRVLSNYIGNIGAEMHESVADRWREFDGSKQQVVLIGKDGESKLFMKELDLADIFVTIDGMPMRQMEMRQSRVSQ